MLAMPELSRLFFTNRKRETSTSIQATNLQSILSKVQLFKPFMRKGSSCFDCLTFAIMHESAFGFYGMALFLFSIRINTKKSRSSCKPLSVKMVLCCVLLLFNYTVSNIQRFLNKFVYNFRGFFLGEKYLKKVYNLKF